ncbi:NAD(P)/FAD-dependent oxidoreductase [Haloimpatiens sp. FM7315]|uniref:NAD(P)/FAD-dependent oxidoreductase n=1 Tax=Haloimpatiens sp. FM7315 TaxID=3298609 RepID=UPI00370CED21
MYDIAIIGAGVIGCNIARELSKYDLNICVIEKNSDIAEGTTKANSAIIHGGFDAKEGTLKAKLNVIGNKMFDELSLKLDFPFIRNGSLVLCFDEKDIKGLFELKKRGENNGVQGLEILDRDKILEMEPNVSSKVVAALYVKNSGIVCPYEMTIALAENAYENGAEFIFNWDVVDIIKNEDGFIIKSEDASIKSKIVINAAGVNGDFINNLVSENKLNIIPRKGEYCLFDKYAGKMFSKTIFQLPTKMGKGVLVTPTVDGNLIIGPNALDVESKEDIKTTVEGLNEVLDKARISIDKVPMRQVITSFAGLRAHSLKDDFIIGESKDVKNLINVAAIESPGLSSSPAIAKMVEEIIVKKLSIKKKKDFNPIRKGIPKFRNMNNIERQKLIKENPLYGNIVCRCETVTEGEIVEAIKRPLGAKNLDGVKRRTRAGMGRCQSGFCSTKIVDILARELGISKLDVTKFGRKSNLLVGKNKEI